MAKEDKKAKKAAAEGDVSLSKEKKDKSEKKEKKKSKEVYAVDTTGDVSMDVEPDNDEVDPSLLSPIARACYYFGAPLTADPLATKPLTKKVFKTIKKASKSRGHVKRGVKEVVKGLRKGEKGYVAPRQTRLTLLASLFSPVTFRLSTSSRTFP